MKPPYANFAEASRSVLQFLHQQYGFDLWMVTRTEGDDWIVLETEDHGYGVKPGNVFRWADSFCSQMVLGKGPSIAPRSDAIDAYRAAPIGEQVEIGAYVGVPLCDADGDLFGTLCGIDPSPKPEELTEALPLIELLGQLLSSYLVAEMRLTASSRLHQLDGLTTTFVEPESGALTRDGWERVLRAEQSRCDMYGLSAYVIAVEVSSGDHAQIREAIGLIRQQISGVESIALLDDRIMVLAPECDEEKGASFLGSINKSLQLAGIKVVVRGKRRDLKKGLAETDPLDSEST